MTFDEIKQLFNDSITNIIPNLNKHPELNNQYAQWIDNNKPIYITFTTQPDDIYDNTINIITEIGITDPQDDYELINYKTFQYPINLYNTNNTPIPQKQIQKEINNAIKSLYLKAKKQTNTFKTQYEQLNKINNKAKLLTEKRNNIINQKPQKINNKITKQQQNELFGFGKKKQQTKTFDDIKPQIKDKLDQYVDQSKTSYDWKKPYPFKGTMVEEDPRGKYLTIHTLYSVWIQVLNSSVIVASSDAGEKTFKYTEGDIESFNKALREAWNSFKTIVKKQGSINSKKNNDWLNKQKENPKTAKALRNADHEDWFSRKVDPYSTAWI